MLTLRTLAALFSDNPVLEKDATTTLRATATAIVVAVVGLAAWMFTAFVHLVQEPSGFDLLTHRGLEPSGRTMFVAVAGALLFLTTVFMPAVASSAVASERERGTLPLLLVSALSPSRIVAGKLAAILVVAVPLLCIALPLFGLASIFGGVSALDVVAALALLAFHVVCIAAVGIGASSLAARARQAAPLAMVFAAVPSVLFGLPLIGALGVYAEGVDLRLVGPVLVVGGAASLAFAVGCLLLARDRLSPASAPRWPLRRLVVGAVLVGLPLLAAFATRVFETADNDRDEMTAVLAVAVAFIVVLTAILEVSIADVRPVDRGTPRTRALLVAALAGLGLLVAGTVPLGSAMEPWLSGALWQTTPLAMPIVIGYVAFCAFATALVARWARTPIARVLLVGAALGALFVVPFVVHELRFLFGSVLDEALAFTNPALVVHDLVRGYGHDSTVASLAFFAASTMIMAALAKGRRAV